MQIVDMEPKQGNSQDHFLSFITNPKNEAFLRELGTKHLTVLMIAHMYFLQEKTIDNICDVLKLGVNNITGQLALIKLWLYSEIVSDQAEVATEVEEKPKPKKQYRRKSVEVILDSEKISWQRQQKWEIIVEFIKSNPVEWQNFVDECKQSKEPLLRVLLLYACIDLDDLSSPTLPLPLYQIASQFLKGKSVSKVYILVNNALVSLGLPPEDVYLD